MKRSGVLPITQFGYRKGLGICDALLCLFHTLQSTWESGQDARIVQTDFSAAFDRVNHQGILYKLCSVGIGGSVLSILTQFLSTDHCTLVHLLAAEPRCTAGLLFPSQCPSGKILLTPYSMVRNYRVSRADPMLFYWPKLLYPYTIVLYCFFLSLLSVNRLVSLSRGILTDRVYITLSQLCTADLF